MRSGWRLAATLALVSIGVLGAAETSAAKTVWLCKPALKSNPCTPNQSTTTFSPSLQKLSEEHVGGSGPRPKYDCFYVYPTVSDQPTLQANRRIDPELRSIALYQAARYSRQCRVYTPVYRQLTTRGITSPDTTPEMRAKAYGDVREAWLTYLRKFNRGRGVVLISHSQGTFMLRDLIKREIDRKPSVRRKLISALLLGGGVTVRKGSDRGGDFMNVRACRSERQLGCVVAFSAFNGPVPADALFGRASSGLETLCTNPAALGGGSGPIEPLFPRAPFAPGSTIGALTVAIGAPRPSVDTAWLSFPGSYSARCLKADGASVLQVSPRGGAPVLTPVPAANWGVHLADVNIALGDLTELVRRQARNFLRRG
jgi:Protein of unknown function (DUF3089)